ncbi:Siphovirus Gp157 [Popillia japonica]|uniref:Siphovirus Gp157 n=1 Tax=Popillia japonica TaxID=7064 RepID=A0AAW1HW85_POPJA
MTEAEKTSILAWMDKQIELEQEIRRAEKYSDKISMCAGRVSERAIHMFNGMELIAEAVGTEKESRRCGDVKPKIIGKSKIRRKKMNLYEIDEAIMNCVDMETGEIVDSDKLAELQIARDDKVEGVGCWIKNLLAEAKALKEEKGILAARQKTCENKAESLKEYLSSALGGQKFKTPKISITYRRSESVEVEDMGKLDDDYLNYSEPAVDKAKVKTALKEGIALEGVKLVENQNIQIKIAMVKNTGLSLLLYKDARVDQNILDETVYPMNWTRHHEMIGNNLYCTVSIYDEDKGIWVSKQDVGTESYTEKEKGQASDSFKRACFNWGIGRELYTAPFVWIPSDKCKIKENGGKCSCYDKFAVEQIIIENKTIVALAIKNVSTKLRVFMMDNRKGGK